MSVMRLTLIVHSSGGNEIGQQDVPIHTVALPDSIDYDEAVELMSRLTTHIDDELKAMAEEDASA